MSKKVVALFVCTGKDCRRAWHKHERSPAKWVKRYLEDADLPMKVQVVETECMDRCEEAACMCVVHAERARTLVEFRGDRDAEKLSSALRQVVEG